jgi:hypothetical protein
LYKNSEANATNSTTNINSIYTRLNDIRYEHSNISQTNSQIKNLISNTIGTNNANTRLTHPTKNGYLEYLTKDTSNSASGVMFNNTGKYNFNKSSTGDYSTSVLNDNKYFQSSYKEKYVNSQGNTENNFRGSSNSNTNTYGNVDFLNEGGSNSNRLPTNSNFSDPTTNLLDMKYNAPKKDDFNLKVSKTRGKSKESDGGKKSDVQFNFKNEDRAGSNSSHNNTNTSNTINKIDINKNKLEKYYSKQISNISNNFTNNNFINNFTHNSPKGNSQGIHFIDNPSPNNTSGKCNTYALTYKEKVMRSTNTPSESAKANKKTQQLNYQFNISNNILHQKKK